MGLEQFGLKNSPELAGAGVLWRNIMNNSNLEKISQLKVVLIEDNQLLVKVIRMQLENYLGITPDIFTTGKKLLQEFTNKTPDYDLAIIDYGLPDITGATLSKKLKKMNCAIKTMCYSANADHVKKLHPEDFDNFVLKPIKNMEQMAEQIEITMKRAFIKPWEEKKNLKSNSFKEKELWQKPQLGKEKKEKTPEGG